jgi:hypothetical protein
VNLFVTSILVVDGTRPGDNVGFINHHQGLSHSLDGPIRVIHFSRIGESSVISIEESRLCGAQRTTTLYGKVAQFTKVRGGFVW